MTNLFFALKYSSNPDFALMEQRMNLTLKTTQPEKNSKSCLIVGVYADGSLTPTAKELDKLSKGFIAKIIKQGGMEGKTGQILPIFSVPNTNFEQIILIGCGKESSVTAGVFHKIINAAVRALNIGKATSAVSYLAEINVTGKTLPWKIKPHAELISTYLICLRLTKKSPCRLPTSSLTCQTASNKKSVTLP
jgi:leucyl aminopeptidase